MRTFGGRALIWTIVLTSLAAGFVAFLVRRRAATYQEFVSGPTPTIRFVADVELKSVSDDGSMFAGVIVAKEKGYWVRKAIGWKPSGEQVKLDCIPTYSSSATVSSDGKTFAGQLYLDGVPFDDKNPPKDQFRIWSREGKTLKAILNEAEPIPSANGKWLLYNTYQRSSDNTTFAFDVPKDVRIWSEDGGEKVLSTEQNTTAHNISDDGTVVAGSTNSVSDTRPLVWIAGNRIELSKERSWPLAMSRDGKWVAGILAPHNGKPRPFRWSKETGFEVLPAPKDSNMSQGMGITDDGKTVILNFDFVVPGKNERDALKDPYSLDGGKTYIDPMNSVYRNSTYVWREGVGAMDLREYLVKRGAKLKPNDAFSFASISPDGHTVLALETKQWTDSIGTWVIKI